MQQHKQQQKTQKAVAAHFQCSKKQTKNHCKKRKYRHKYFKKKDSKNHDNSQYRKLKSTTRKMAQTRENAYNMQQNSNKNKKTVGAIKNAVRVQPNMQQGRKSTS